MVSFQQLFVLLLLLLCTTTISSAKSEGEPRHLLRVWNTSDSGVGSLSHAIKTASVYNNLSVEILISEGDYPLETNATFVGWKDFVLVGEGIDETSVVCNKGVGLVFSSCSQVSIYNLTIKGCGRVFTTTSIDFTDASSVGVSAFLESKTALYFNSCSNVSFQEMQVQGSYGAGVTLYNTNGTNLFLSSHFHTNYMDRDDPYPGGGGVVIETSQCAPGDMYCKDNHTSIEISNSQYIFEHCSFKHNKASSHYHAFDSIYPHGRSHMGLGRGGGLSVILKGRAFQNKVTITCCQFDNNNAEWGGGLYVAFGDHSIQNAINVMNSSFDLNTDRGQDVATNITVGGAVRIEMVSYPPNEQLWPGYHSNVSGNEIVIRRTDFTMNFATWGGALSFASTRSVPGQVHPNSLLIDDCFFTQNQANIAASAVDITSWKPSIVDSTEPFPLVVLKDCSFYLNSMLFFNITGYSVGLGAVYIADIPARFTGTSNFTNNNDTAMVVSGTYVSISKSSVMNFVDNTGRHGGALAFIGNSWAISHEGARFFFYKNSVGVYGLGGAVYSVHFGEHDLFYRQNCFFRYHSHTVPPSQWNATFTFEANSADGKPNSIYTTSSFPCSWQSIFQSQPQSQPLIKVTPFCENSTWIFRGEDRNCLNEIATGPSEVNISNINIKVFPGWNTTLGVQALSDYGLRLPSVFTASLPDTEDIVAAIANSTKYISDDTIILYGQENTSTNLRLMTLDPRVVASELKMHIQSCPPGFVGVQCTSESFPNMTCDCICSKTPGVSCDYGHKEAFLESLNCITYGNTEETLVISPCPYRRKGTVKLSSLTAAELEDEVCKPLNRVGYLCSNCRDGYGVAVNRLDYSCVPCKEHQKYDWVFFLLVELGPITLACFVMVLFGVSVVSPSLNAFVFFSQIVSVAFSTNYYTWYYGVDYVDVSLSQPILTLYGMWNLEFFKDLLPPVCLHDGLTALSIQVINYVKALYPMLLILICYIAIKIYDRNFRVLRCLWRPFRSLQRVVYRHIDKPNTSIIDAFASLIILSYCKFLYVSFPLVTLISVHELSRDSSNLEPTVLRHRYYFEPSQVLYHSATNVIYFILGMTVLVLFVALPPIFLILYPLGFMQACISRLGFRLQITLRTFADAFLGGFRDGTEKGGGGRDCRWMASVYLLLRLVYFTIYTYTDDWMTEYLVLQILLTLVVLLFALVRPYKVDFYNHLDICFFTYLAVLNSLSSYNKNADKIERAVFYINYLLLYLPLGYILCLLVYKLLIRKWWHTGMQRRFSKSEIQEESYASTSADESSSRITEKQRDSGLPHRFLCPQDYSSINQFRSNSTTSNTEEKRESKSSDEKTPLLPRSLSEEGGACGDGDGRHASRDKERHTAPPVAGSRLKSVI